MAMMLHPDKNRAPLAEDAFKKINEGLQTLVDPTKRRVRTCHAVNNNAVRVLPDYSSGRSTFRAKAVRHKLNKKYNVNQQKLKNQGPSSLSTRQGFLQHSVKARLDATVNSQDRQTHSNSGTSSHLFCSEINPFVFAYGLEVPLTNYMHLSDTCGAHFVDICFLSHALLLG